MNPNIKPNLKLTDGAERSFPSLFATNVACIVTIALTISTSAKADAPKPSRELSNWSPQETSAGNSSRTERTQLCEDCNDDSAYMYTTVLGASTVRIEASGPESRRSNVKLNVSRGNTTLCEENASFTKHAVALCTVTSDRTGDKLSVRVNSDGKSSVIVNETGTQTAGRSWYTDNGNHLPAMSGFEITTLGNLTASVIVGGKPVPSAADNLVGLTWTPLTVGFSTHGHGMRLGYELLSLWPDAETVKPDPLKPDKQETVTVKMQRHGIPLHYTYLYPLSPTWLATIAAGPTFGFWQNGGASIVASARLGARFALAGKDIYTDSNHPFFGFGLAAETSYSTSGILPITMVNAFFETGHFLWNR